MRKIIATLAIALAALFVFVPHGLQAGQLTITIDGETVEFANHQPIIFGDRTWVPIFNFFDHLGLEADWQEQWTVVRGHTADFWHGVTAFDFDGIPMAPVRDIMQGMGYRVEWDGLTHAVIISTIFVDDGNIPEYITIGGERFSTTLTALDLSNRGLNDEDTISLRYMVNLTRLWMEHNYISDLTPLAGMARLYVLGLWNNNVSDLSPIAEHTNLTWLDLTGNNISDISPLAGLVNLQQLYMGQNQISNIAPLAGLTQLSSLILIDNQIQDITPLAPLVGSLWQLNLGNNQIENIEPLSELARFHGMEYAEYLAELFLIQLHDNPITDWSPVSHIYNVVGRP